MAMRITEWFKRRMLAGPVAGDWDWPILDIAADGASARMRFDGLSVKVTDKRVTVALTWRGKELMEYAHREWLDFEHGETLTVNMGDLDGTVGLSVG